eukprot:2967279-Amphidinium_carterae.2
MAKDGSLFLVDAAGEMTNVFSEYGKLKDGGAVHHVGSAYYLDGTAYLAPDKGAVEEVAPYARSYMRITSSKNTLMASPHLAEGPNDWLAHTWAVCARHLGERDLMLMEFGTSPMSRSYGTPASLHSQSSSMVFACGSSEGSPRLSLNSSEPPCYLRAPWNKPQS